MLREIKTKKGRAIFVRFLKIMFKLKLANGETAHDAMLQVVFSELSIRAKE